KRGPGGRESGSHGLLHPAQFKLLLQRPVFAVDEQPGGGLEQNQVVIGDLIKAAHKDPAWLVLHLRPASSADQTVYLVVQGLPVDGDVVDQDHHLDRQPLHAPIGVRPDELADDSDVLHAAYPKHGKRNVARDPEAPEAALVAALSTLRP